MKIKTIREKVNSVVACYEYLAGRISATNPDFDFGKMIPRHKVLKEALALLDEITATEATKIQELEEEIREFQHLFEGFSIEKYTNPEFFTSSTAKQYCYSVTMKDMEESFNKFQALKDNT